MAYVIDQSQCINCSWCRRECPTSTIEYYDREERKHFIDTEGCIDCDICARVCPMSCISHQPEVLPTPEHLKEAKERARTWARGRRKITLAIRSYADREIARKAEA
jgi:ferredoxin